MINYTCSQSSLDCAKNNILAQKQFTNKKKTKMSKHVLVSALSNKMETQKSTKKMDKPTKYKCITFK